MSYRRRVRSRSDIYWPAFVDIFVVLLAVSLLALPEKPPPGIMCNSPNHCVPPEPKVTPMRSEQFLVKRLSCRLDIALRELKPALPNAVASGNSILVRIPGPPVQDGGGDLSEETKRTADTVKSALFDSGLRSHWSDDPVSIEITEVATEFVSGPQDQAASASYIARLHGYISTSLEAIRPSVSVAWSGTVRGSASRPQLFITIITALTEKARAQAEAERLAGMEPCPISP